jgi:polyhydroxybutyrate depolymerase
VKKRLLGCALVIVSVVVLAVILGAWLLWVPKPAVPPLQGELRKSSVVVDGRTRTFSFYVPPRVRPNSPLLLVLHGSMMNGAQMRVATGHAFDEIGDREGLIVAYPDGYGGHWNDCRAVGDYESKRLGVDDVAFLETLVRWFERNLNVAPDEVFATGVSNGAQMSYRLALEAPDVVRGIAAIAANLPTAENQTCKPSGRPVATMIVNGTDDPLNPHDGGLVALFGVFVRRGNVQSTLATAQYWANLAGHRAPPVLRDLPNSDRGDGTTAKRHDWTGDGRPPVSLVVIEGGGHSIPHPKIRAPRLLGRTSHDLSAADEIWGFLSWSPKGARLR